MSQIDPSLVLYEPKWLDDVIGAGVAQERFALLLVASFALLALVLAAVGIYGVLSYSVSRRTREMGIRMALGAPAASVRTLIVRDGGRLAVLGIVLGSVGAYAATRALRSAAVRGQCDRAAGLCVSRGGARPGGDGRQLDPGTRRDESGPAPSGQGLTKTLIPAPIPAPIPVPSATTARLRPEAGPTLRSPGARLTAARWGP